MKERRKNICHIPRDAFGDILPYFIAYILEIQFCKQR